MCIVRRRDLENVNNRLACLLQQRQSFSPTKLLRIWQLARQQVSCPFFSTAYPYCTIYHEKFNVCRVATSLTYIDLQDFLGTFLALLSNFFFFHLLFYFDKNNMLIWPRHQKNAFR